MVTLRYSWELLLHTNQGDKYYREKVLQEVEQDFSSYDKNFFVHNLTQTKPYMSQSDLYRQKQLMFHFVTSNHDYYLEILKKKLFISQSSFYFNHLKMSGQPCDIYMKCYMLLAWELRSLWAIFFWH